MFGTNEAFKEKITKNSKFNKNCELFNFRGYLSFLQRTQLAPDPLQLYFLIFMTKILTEPNILLDF